MKPTKLPRPTPEVFKSFTGNSVDVTIYSRGGSAHWVHLTHNDGAEETVRVMSRAKAVILANNLYKAHNKESE